MRPASAVLAALALVVAAACGPTAQSPSSSPPRPAVSPSPAGVSPSPAAVASPSPAAGSLVDASLLDLLPPDVDGIAIRDSAESDAVASRDPVVLANAIGVVTALAVDPPSGEFAHATLVRLRPGVFGDRFFRDWRDSFNEGACSQAGGVAGVAEAEIGGRLVHIGSCAGGVRVYHAWLESPGVLVSVSAVGDRRLGERLMGELREQVGA